MKKIISAIILLIIFCLGVVGFAGCQRTEDDPPRKRLPEYESGYFRYAVDTLPSGKQKAYLIGLTKSGKQQTELIYPDTIDGYTVYGIGYEISLVMGSEFIDEIHSDNLKKFFMPAVPIEKKYMRQEFYSMVKIICFDSNYGKTRPYWEETFTIGENIIGYNIYLSELWKYDKDWIYFNIANVSYLYNYDNAPNDGYYWVDSYDKSLITFIPPEPIRDGYTFGGWYKNPECTDIWNFDTDITGREINENSTNEKSEYGFEGIRPYTGIYLYAKWTKVN